MRSIRCLFLVLLLAAGHSALAGVPTIRLSASRPAALCDGRDYTEIIAEVRDFSGSYVPDGTLVTFATNLGQFSPGPVVATRTGSARVRISSIQKGSATVTATIPGGGFERLEGIVFTDDPADTIQGNAFVAVQSTGGLLYSATDRVVEASARHTDEPAKPAQGGARVNYRNLSVSAERVQVDCTMSALRAEGNVRLVRGSHHIDCARLYYPLLAGDGYAVTESDRKVQVVKLTGADLNAAPAAYGTFAPKQFEMVDLSDAPLVVTARHIVYFPGEKVQFKLPRFYQQGQHLLTLPFYSMSLYSAELFTEQFVSFGSQGVGVNVPLYYDLTPSSTGVFRIRHGEQTGDSIFATRPGWALDVTQSYSAPGSRSKLMGQFGFTGINRSDWGFRWTHSQEFDGATRGSFFLDVPQHRALYTSANLNRQFGLVQMGLNLSANRTFTGYAMSGEEADIYLETMPRKVGRTGYMMAFGGNASNSHASSQSYKLNLASEGVQARFFSMPFRPDKQTTVTNNISVGNVWTNTGANGASVLASVQASRSLLSNATLQMTYDFSKQPVMLPGTGEHRLSASLMANGGQKWNLNLFGSKLLDVPGDSLMGDFSYGFARRWRFSLTATLQRFAIASYNDLSVGLGRTIGGRDVVVSYSTYNHRFYFDLMATRF